MSLSLSSYSISFSFINQINDKFKHQIVLNQDLKNKTFVHRYANMLSWHIQWGLFPHWRRFNSLISSDQLVSKSHHCYTNRNPTIVCGSHYIEIMLLHPQRDVVSYRHDAIEMQLITLLRQERGCFQSQQKETAPKMKQEPTKGKPNALFMFLFSPFVKPT
jgi:hypothetical protein